jgi:hypothetical protein
MAKDDVQGGRFYGRTSSGRLVPVSADDAGPPDVWICRRVADYPGQQIPTGGEVDTCGNCFAPIVFNPARAVAAPRICMQCAKIQPLPIE